MKTIILIVAILTGAYNTFSSTEEASTETQTAVSSYHKTLGDI